MENEEKLLEESYGFYNEAIKELEEGIKEGNTIKLCDAAEKAWNAVVQATNALILKRIGFLPKSHYERRRALKEIEDKDKELAKLGIYDRYAARSRLLHGEVFYKGILDHDLLRLEIKKALEFIEIIKKSIIE